MGVPGILSILRVDDTLKGFVETIGRSSDDDVDDDDDGVGRHRSNEVARHNTKHRGLTKGEKNKKTNISITCNTNKIIGTYSIVIVKYQFNTYSVSNV